jgi:hypothetical protein
MKIDRRIVYVVTVLIVLIVCAILSIILMPLYYVMLSDAIPPSMAVRLQRSRWLPEQDGMNRSTIYKQFIMFCLRILLFEAQTGTLHALQL